MLVPRKVFFQCQVFNARERTWWNIPAQHLLQNSFCFGWKKPTIRRSCFIMFFPYVAPMPNLKGMRFQLHVWPSNAMNWLAVRQSDPPVLSLCSWRKRLEWHLPSEPTAPRLARNDFKLSFLLTASWEKCNVKGGWITHPPNWSPPFLPKGGIFVVMQIHPPVDKDLQQTPPMRAPILKLASHGDLPINPPHLRHSGIIF